MVRVPLMTPIGYGGGSSCSLSSRSQAAQCNIHQAFIIALLALLCFHGAAFITITIGYVDILIFRMNRPHQDEYTLPALLIAGEQLLDRFCIFIHALRRVFPMSYEVKG